MTRASVASPRDILVRTPEPVLTEQPKPRRRRVLIAILVVFGLAIAGGLWLGTTLNRWLIPDPARSRALESLGGLTAAHLYQTYLNIGMLADATEGGVYTKPEAKKLLLTLLNMLDTIDQQLATVTELELGSEDANKLEQTSQLTALLYSQASELQAYWETGNKDHATKYHQLRAEVWVGIKDLLGLDD